MNKIDKTKRKTGDIYIAKYSTGDKFINMHNGEKGMNVSCYIDIGGNSFYEGVHEHGAECYEATEEQKRWLLTCKERGKFIPLQDIAAIPIDNPLIFN